MKKVELESLLKSFFLFFTSQLLLVGALFFLDYKKELSNLDASLFSKMSICSFNLSCEEFVIDFAPLKESQLYKLHKTQERVSTYFSIAGSTQNALEIYLHKKEYDRLVDTLKNELTLKFIVVVAVLMLLSLLFSLYALSPFRNALRLTEEFIKDILHDFNTPLSTLRLNISMLKSSFGKNSKLERMERSVETILSLQSNLRSYLVNHTTQKESLNLLDFLNERVLFIDKMYKDIHFYVEVPPIEIKTNREAFTRVIDNLLTNAAKYNKKEGSVHLTLENQTLKIQDTGKGIQNPKRVFDRFYKEQARGIGIGLHIVHKLCEELQIPITLESQVNKGTTFSLNLKALTLN